MLESLADCNDRTLDHDWKPCEEIEISEKVNTQAVVKAYYHNDGL